MPTGFALFSLMAICKGPSQIMLKEKAPGPCLGSLLESAASWKTGWGGGAPESPE